MRAATGDLVDVAVDMTPRPPLCSAQTVKRCRTAGTVVVAGTRGGVRSEFDADQIVYMELRVLCALGVDTVSYTETFELLAAGRFRFEALPRRVASLDDLGDLPGLMAGESSIPHLHAVVVPK